MLPLLAVRSGCGTDNTAAEAGRRLAWVASRGLWVGLLLELPPGFG